MKSQNASKDTRPKISSREQSRKSSVVLTNNLLKNIPHSMPHPPKSIFLNSHRASRPKIDSIAIPSHAAHPSSTHSRKASINSTTAVLTSGRAQVHSSTRESREMPRRHQKDPLRVEKEKERSRSNSTVSKKQSRETKNCLKIDLSRFKEEAEVGREQFERIYVIGKGGFGKVWCVRQKKTQRIFAMKEMHKTKIIGKKSIHSVLNERELLSKLKHPCIANMSYAFQDRENLYLIMDLLVGGDLRYHMGCRRRFKETEAKFFIACILIGLEFLHLNNIIHRDIKPENLVFDDKGYIRITDLGIARAVKPNNSADTSGTPGYMAPEVMCRQDHSFPVDYYAVGVIAYELMLGRRPYNGRNRKEIRDQILSKQVQVRAEEVPSSWSVEAADFVNRMIQRKPAQRLGTEHGIIEIKEHPWFRNFPWVQLLKKNIASPYVPANVLDSHHYREQISESSEEEDLEQNRLLLRKKSVEELFSGYSYYAREGREKQKSSTNATTTGGTHYSYLEEREAARVKSNNFLKG